VTAPGAAPGGGPAVPVEARELLPGCVHLAFRDGRGVALHRATGEFVIYTCVESGRGLAGNYYRPERLLDRRRDHLEAAGADWLLPWLRRLKDGEPASTDDLLDQYRERYGNDPVAS
jgi:hypothetical protein